MFENPYLEKIAQLRNGELPELIVEREEFMLFREAWSAQPDRSQIVGEAGLNARIIYRYQKSS